MGRVLTSWIEKGHTTARHPETSAHFEDLRLCIPTLMLWDRVLTSWIEKAHITVHHPETSAHFKELRQRIPVVILCEITKEALQKFLRLVPVQTNNFKTSQTKI